MKRVRKRDIVVDLLIYFNKEIDKITWAFDKPSAAAISSRSAGDKYFW